MQTTTYNNKKKTKQNHKEILLKTMFKYYK